MAVNRNKLFIFFFIIIFLFCNLCHLAKAQDDEPVGAWNGDNRVDPMTQQYIKEVSPGTEKAVDKGTWNSIKNFFKEFDYTKYLEALKKTTAIGYKVALKAFLEQLAHDTAVKLASGGNGQTPLIESRTMGNIVSDAADNAAGLFIQELGKKGAFSEKFNICEPDFSIKYKIIVGLGKPWQKQKPACTFSTMLKNWDKELKSADFLPKFQDLFKPQSNDLGIAFTVQTNLSSEIDKKISEATNTAVKNSGFKDVTDKISGWIRTPANTVRDFSNNAIQKSGQNYFTYTGSAVADSIDVFINTLIGTLINRWLDPNRGQNTTAPTKPNWNFDLNNPQGQLTYGGITGAKDRYKDLIEPKFNVRGDYNILAELTICSDPTKAGPTNCVITDNFRQAIENRKTVGQAIKEGFLNASGIFGFTSDGLEPPYNEAYPYRSMPILRKFRIIPVGWEIAAQYIKDFAGKTYNLGDMVACYDPADDYAGLDEAWCHGLVDPSWVLKAPLNYCRREGPGPEIISEQITGEGDTSQRVVARNEKYCGDEQSCIKENNDGSCQLYGYCAEERRKWQLNANSCEPKYNTCQTFKSEAGNTVSYLENTLDYGTCNADNVGCKAYCTAYDFANSKWTCTAASVNDKLHLDKNAEQCDAESEGCSEIIRTKADTGANLIKNSSFEIYTGTIDVAGDESFDQWGGIGEAVSDSFDAATAVKLSGNLSKAIDVGPADYSIAGEIYSFSFYAKNCAAGDTYNIEGQAAAQKLSAASDWAPYQTTYVFPKTAVGNQVIVKINSSSCVIDAVKLERGHPAAYTDYRGAGLEYLKIAPNYLNCDGIGDPAECAKFARKCQTKEVGCDLYTSVSDHSSIPAKALAQDYCSAECAGYDAYIQGASAFDSLRDAYFIPKTAKACGAEAAGCDQFTNLDEVKKGGEGTEYYSNLRQCVRSDDPAANCGEFYTWEGSEETGYQLRVYQLEKNGVEPTVTEDDSSECDKNIYSLSPADPAYNPDCREFYNKSGDVYYHLYTRTKTCSANCHPYRRSENNVDPAITDPANCSAAGSGYIGVTDGQFHWDGDKVECIFCKNGGEWNEEQNACVNMAIPNEGAQCSANENGCREYRGNAGNNVRVASVSDFEGSLQNWAGVSTNVELSNTALINGGNSLFVKDGNFSAALKIGATVEKGNPYVLNFIAKSAGAGKITSIKLANGAGEEAAFSVSGAALAADWQYYKVSLPNLDHKVDADEKLIITGDGAFYIDDIKLIEITDVYYLIKNSWTTPDACYYDIENNYVGPYVNAGCDEYRDRGNKTHYLHQFSQLCSDAAIGCEAVINTHNSKDYNAQTFNAGDPSEITAPADSYDYIIYDQKKKCGQEDKGCQRLGQPAPYGNTVLHSDAYLKNNPDKYDSIMCKADEVYCGEWTSDSGSVYFKDPGDMLCEWRQKSGQAAESWGWYKTKVKRCDSNKNGVIDGAETAVCLSSRDCASGISCVNDENDYDCPTSNFKTLGFGGIGNSILQPAIGADGNWAGLCPAAQSGCTEYIEPVSRFMSNMLFNGEFSQDVDINGLADGWSAKINGVQNRILEANTLYIIAVEGANTAELNSTGNDFYELGNNNRLTGPVNQITVNSSAGSRASKQFYARTSTSIKIKATDASSKNGSKIELKQAIIDYKLKQDLDETTCNGIVDFEQGCVLFNKRAQNGSSPENMKWDADLTVNDGAGANPQSGADADKDANIILKVSPDRVCGKWLACRSYIKDENNNNVCFDIGLCDSVDNNGNCNNFVVTKKENMTYPLGDIGKISNLAGYTKAGVDWGANKVEGNYPVGDMEQVGQTASVANGGFEFYGSNGYPIGWNYTGAAGWNANVFSVVNNPFAAQREGIGYAPVGSSFLKLGSEYSAASEYIDVAPDMDYILTAYINTKNLPGNSAAVNIEQFRSGSGSLGGADIVSLAGSNDWTYQLGYFKTNPSAAKIKITLHSQAGATGNFYFDDVKIRPALNSKNNGGNPWYTAQSCRLYPKSDSLSCDYYDDSGIMNKGWSGYCLEYDRYPGSRDACILWWPADKVKGEGVEEGAGYLGKVPVYYCAEAASLKLLEYRTSYLWRVVTEEWWDNWCNCWDDPDACGADYELCLPDSNNCYRAPSGVCRYNCVNNGCVRSGWYDYNGFQKDQAGFGIKFYNPQTGEIFDDVSSYCTKIAKTVNNVGDNKYWSGRVYEGSNYKIPGLNYQYTTDSAPFGSIKTPSPSGNPYEWDGNSARDGIQPLYASESYNASHPYRIVNNTGTGSFGVCKNSEAVCFHIDGVGYDLNKADCKTGDVCNIVDFTQDPIEKIKRIFAQSYGIWNWDAAQNRYVPGGGDWPTPQNICASDPRPAYPNDFCGIKPKIFNLKVNDKIADYIIAMNQFVNFTFNTSVDSQQLPLVMYAIDWGDNEYTTVTGVEMRDRPNSENPHSMYHLYSYWDLKAKNATAQSENSVYCGDAGGDAVNNNRPVGSRDSGFNCPAASDCCIIKPSVKIKDNWGWCNNGADGTPCPNDGYQNYTAWIVVMEK